MKSYRYLILAALVLLMGVSWYSLISGRTEVDADYEGKLATAREYAAMGSTNYAVSYYNAAIAIKSSPELYAEVAEYYKYHGEARDYTAWCENFLEVYPLSPLSYDKMLEIYYGDENFSSCFSLINTAKRRGVTSEFIESVYDSIYNEYALGSREYTDVGPFSCGYCSVRDKDGIWEYVDTSGSLTTLYCYAGANAFGDPLRASVTDLDGNLCFIDVYGEKILTAPTGYTAFGIYSGGLVAARGSNGKYTYLDKDFNMPVGFGEYDDAGTFSGGLAAVKDNGRWYFIATDGSRFGTADYSAIKMDDRGLAFRQSRAFVKEDSGKWAMIDETGAKVGSNVFDDVVPFGNSGPAAVKLDGKWVFVETDGSIKNADGYDRLRSYNNGFAAVQKNGLWGFMDADGNLIIAPAFTDTKTFTDKGSCFVQYEGVWRLLYLYRFK